MERERERERKRRQEVSNRHKDKRVRHKKRWWGLRETQKEKESRFTQRTTDGWLTFSSPLPLEITN